MCRSFFCNNIGEYEKNAASVRESIVAVLSFVKSQFCENLINDKNNPLNYFLNLHILFLSLRFDGVLVPSFLFSYLDLDHPSKMEIQFQIV